MGVKRKWMLLSAIIIIGLLGAGVWYYMHLQRAAAPEEEAPLQTIEIWEQVNQRFATGTTEQLVLWRKDSQELYVQHNQLYYTSGKEEAPVLLQQWASSLPAQAFVNGNYLLIGAQTRTASASQTEPAGLWLAIELAEKPKVVEKGEQFFGPNEIVASAFTQSANLFSLTMKLQNRLTQRIYDPANNRWHQVSDKPIPGEELALFEKDNAVHYLQQQESYELSEDETMDVFDDSGSSLVYFSNPGKEMLRFDGYELLVARPIYKPDQTLMILGHLRDSAGNEAAVFFERADLVLPIDERLWQGKWLAVDPYNFVQITSEAIDVLQYEEGFASIDNEPVYKQFQLGAAKLISENGLLAEFEVEGKKQLLHFYDLVHTEADTLDSIWAEWMQDPDVQAVDNSELDPVWENHNIVEWGEEERNANAEVPPALQRAVDELYSDSDYVFAKTFRYLKSTWYVLVEKDFYQYQKNKLTKLGEWPVTIEVAIGEGASGFGAMDFVKLEQGWLVADTKANRVIKLDRDMKIAAELSVPVPSKLIVKQGSVHIESLLNEIVTDLDLLMMETNMQEFKAATAVVDQDYLKPRQWYKDEASGLVWYSFMGRLFQYDGQNEQFKSAFLGISRNAHAKAQIFPYKDTIAVMLDHRLELFDREGNWLGDIQFPRSEPDGIYDRTPEAENKAIIDEDAGKIFLVQGYRILSIDLESKQVTSLFRQNYAEIADMQMHDGKLYVLLHNHIEDRYHYSNPVGDESQHSYYSELVQIDPADKHIERAITEGFYRRIVWQQQEIDEVGEGNEEPAQSFEKIVFLKAEEAR